jgi:hypothetical protein
MRTPSRTNLRCDAHHRCRPTPQYSYEACYSLAHQRGWTDRRFDARGLNAFIYKCMLGQIPW